MADWRVGGSGTALATLTGHGCQSGPAARRRAVVRAWQCQAGAFAKAAHFQAKLASSPGTACASSSFFNSKRALFRNRVSRAVQPPSPWPAKAAAGSAAPAGAPRQAARLELGAAAGLRPGLRCAQGLPWVDRCRQPVAGDRQLGGLFAIAATCPSPAPAPACSGTACHCNAQALPPGTRHQAPRTRHATAFRQGTISRLAVVGLWPLPCGFRPVPHCLHHNLFFSMERIFPCL